MSPQDFQSEVDKHNQQKQQQADEQARLNVTRESGDKVAKAVNDGTQQTAKALKSVKGEVKVTNPDLAKTQDVDKLIKQLKEVQLANLMSNAQPTSNISLDLGNLAKISDLLSNVVAELKKSNPTEELVKVLTDKLDGLAKALTPKPDPQLKSLVEKVGKLDVKPVVNVPKPNVNITTTAPDLSPLNSKLDDLLKAFGKIDMPKLDIEPLLQATKDVKKTLENLRFPVPNFQLPFQTQTGKDAQVKLNDDGSLPITASISTGALATSAKQSDGSQKTQIVDGSGNVVGSTTNALDVNIKSGSSAGTQYTEDAVAAADPVGNAVNLVRKDTPAATVSADGDNIAQRGTNFGAAYVTLLDASGNTVSVGGGTQYAEDAASAGGESMTLAGAVRQDTIGSNTSTDGDYTYLKTTSAGRLYTDSVVSSALPAGTNVIGHVIADTGSTTAVTGNVTVVQSTATNLKVDASGVAVPVTDNGGSLTVDNGGTFAVQATLAAGATNIAKAEDVASADADVGVPSMAIRKATPANTSGTDGDYEMLQMSAGRLWVDASGKTLTVDGSGVTQPVSGTVTTTPPSNASTNIAQINAVTPLMGNGITGTGSLRVTVASDNTAFAVNSTLSAETTKVIGVTRSADGAGNLLTTNSTTYTAKFGLDSNLLGTLGTAFSTAGKVDVKGADGDIFVRQTTAANLNATVVGTGTFAVQATIAAGATSIAKAEDVASADADVGIPALAVRKATPANTSGTDGDYEFLQISAGRLWVDASGKTLTVDGSGVTQPVSIAGTVVVDDLAAAATGAAVPSNAQYQGNLAQTALPSAASAGNLTGNLSDKFGRGVILNNALRDIVSSQRTTIASSTSETTIVTAIASTFNDIFLLTVKNTSATALRVDIRDTTAGTIIDDIYVPAGDTRGWAPTTPLPQTSVNTNWTATCSASVSDVRVTVWYIKNK